MLRPMLFTLTLAVENIFSDEIVGRSPITGQIKGELSCVKQVLGGIMVLFSEAPSFTAVAVEVPP